MLLCELKSVFKSFCPRKSVCPSIYPHCPVLHSSERFLFLAGGSLVISEVMEEDVGMYTCIADNGNETIEAQAELAVQGRKNI